MKRKPWNESELHMLWNIRLHTMKPRSWSWLAVACAMRMLRHAGVFGELQRKYTKGTCASIYFKMKQAKDSGERFSRAEPQFVRRGKMLGIEWYNGRMIVLNGNALYDHVSAFRCTWAPLAAQLKFEDAQGNSQLCSNRRDWMDQVHIVDLVELSCDLDLEPMEWLIPTQNEKILNTATRRSQSPSTDRILSCDDQIQNQNQQKIEQDEDRQNQNASIPDYSKNVENFTSLIPSYIIDNGFSSSSLQKQDDTDINYFRNSSPQPRDCTNNDDLSNVDFQIGNFTNENGFGILLRNKDDTNSISLGSFNLQNQSEDWDVAQFENLLSGVAIPSDALMPFESSLRWGGSDFDFSESSEQSESAYRSY